MARPDVEGIFILNESAAKLWRLRQEEHSLSAIVRRFADEYGLDEQRAANDIADTFAFWRDQVFSPQARSTRSARLPTSTPKEWAVDESYRINATRIRVRIADPDVAVEICPRLERIRSHETGETEIEFRIWSSEDSIVLFQGDDLIASEPNANAIRAILLQEMVRRAEPSRDWLAILHAGAFGAGNECVLVAGKSHSGKTTLCAALMASGRRFYCDDSAAIDRQDGAVSPMPFGMMIRPGSWEVLSRKFPGLTFSPAYERYGQTIRFLNPPLSCLAGSPARAKALLFVSYAEGEKTRIDPVLPFEMLLRLQESGFWVQHDRQSIGQFLEWLELLPAFSLTYSDLDDAISKICEVSDQ